MSATFTQTDKLGDIVVKFPQASEIFQQYGIDFCCGGDQLFQDAVTEHGVNGTLVLKELNQTYSDALQQGKEIVDWSSVSLEELIHHIVNTHHAYLQQIFPQLSELTAKILRVHGEHHGQMLSQVHRLFNTLRLDMEEHMIKEEEQVFPHIIAYEKNPSLETLLQVIEEVELLDKEHDETGTIVKKLRSVTDGYALPADACATFTRVFHELEHLETDLFQHIHLENNVLFAHLLQDRSAYPSNRVHSAATS